MLIPKTLNDAYNEGYRITETKHVRGYLSRAINEYEQPVKIAGGLRRGQMYVDLPCYISSTYHYRCYLTKPLDK